MDILPQLFLQLLLILLNAFFAATEIAFVSLNENKLKYQSEEGDKKATKILKMIQNPTGSSGGVSFRTKNLPCRIGMGGLKRSSKNYLTRTFFS